MRTALQWAPGLLRLLLRLVDSFRYKGIGRFTKGTWSCGYVSGCSSKQKSMIENLVLIFVYHHVRNSHTVSWVDWRYFQNKFNCTIKISWNFLENLLKTQPPCGVQWKPNENWWSPSWTAAFSEKITKLIEIKWYSWIYFESISNPLKKWYGSSSHDDKQKLVSKFRSSIFSSSHSPIRNHRITFPL